MFEKPFYPGLKYGGNVSEGGKKDGAKDAGGQGPRGGGDNAGERGTRGQQQDRKNQAAAQSRGNVAPGVKADDRNRSLMDNTPTDVARSFINEKKAQADYAGEDDTFLDKIANFIAGGFGWSEANPATQSVESFKDFDTAEDQIDPVAAALGLAGLGFAPATLAGLGYRAVKGISGYEGPQISLRGSPGSSYDAPGGVNTASGTKSGLGGLGEPNGNNLNREGEFGARGSPSYSRPRPPTTSVKAPTQTAATPPDPNTPTGLVQLLLDYYQPVGIAQYDGPGQQITGYQLWDNPIPTADQLNAGDYGVYTGEQNFGRANLTLPELLKQLQGKKHGGATRGPQGEVRGKGGPKDDLIGPFMLSNQEYVLPKEMIDHFGGGNYDHGIAQLENIRRKVLR